MLSDEPPQLPAHSGSVLDTLTRATAAADDAARHASAVADQLLGLSAVSLRQQGYTDRLIAHRFQVDEVRIAAAARAVGVLLSPQDRSLRDDIERQWNQARRGLTWYQDDRVVFSRDIVHLYGIDTSGSHPLSVDALDLPAAEFVNRSTGERFLVYSLQRWKGIPLPQLDAGQPVWSGRGTFTLEYLTPAGERMVVTGEDWLGLPKGATDFVRTAEQSSSASSDDAFEGIITAFRRQYGALPPYLDAATLALNYRHPQ